MYKILPFNQKDHQEEEIRFPKECMSVLKTPLSSQPQLICRQFRDVDELTQLLNTHREVRVEPLSLEPFQATMYQVDFEALTLIFGEVLSPIHLTGARRSGFTQFGVFLQLGGGPALVHQRSVDIDTLCGFDASRGSNNIYPQNTLIGEIQVRQDLLESTLGSMRRDDLDARFFKREFIHLPRMLSTYRSYMQQLFHLVKQRSPLLKRSDYGRLIIGDLLPLLIDVIPRRKPHYQLPPHPAQRTKLVHRARDYIHAHIHEPLTLKDIYTALGVSRRTLFYSFESIFMVTPMEYIKAQRLQGARRSLKQADPKTTSIASIAYDWGFYNSGHFAKAYKAMFNELPSKTLGLRY
jgi:AraC family ethanolamine operon transcriptional activator